jgi:uncharacterized protein with PQ loop repeat
MDIHSASGNTAIGLSACFYLSLFAPFCKVLACKLNYEYTPIALIDTVFVDCLCWYIYGEKMAYEPLKLGNCIGGIASLTLIVIYLIFEIRKYTVDSILNALILILGALVIQKGLTIVVEDPLMVGRICIGTKLITFGYPLLMIYRTIRGKNYMFISVSITLTYLAACLGWCFFGQNKSDSNIMWANGIGVILGIIQFLVYLNYRKKYQYNLPTKTIGIEKGTGDDNKKDDSINMNFDEEGQEKGKEKPVKIISKVDN